MNDFLYLDALPDILRVEEVAKLLRISRATAYESVRRNELPSVRIGKRVLIPKAALKHFLIKATEIHGG
jgi:excisionase family DNA binding protein